MATNQTSTMPRRAKSATPAPRQKRAARREAAPPATGHTLNTPAGATTPEMTSGAAPETRCAASKGPGGKLGIVVGLMRRPEGATVAQMGEATGWQPHSVRGAMAGSLKRKHKLTIVGQAGETGRVYRIAAEQPA